ncbi:EAL domain-containing protein [Acidovorax sp. A1169]|uniref:bifunctional diguanylate cyclase/phosphodiesterase n=1 Tax=Acidovorax sp. A1169 TaxID=3059524 RepID=UPI0027378736|nr:EAL domain-containing protein [Acidovorax sp. A1169]MDP4074003.1 EAL domain-containing protein [Acidovorax sp. A1169]
MRAFQLSLRTAIAVPFAALFAATVVLQAVTQHRQISQLIDQESVRVLEALTGNSRARLAEFLETPFLIQSTVADAISRHGLYQEGNLRPVYTHLRGVFSDLYAGQQQISLLSFGSRAGEYTGIRREPGEGFRLILKDATTNGMMNVYEDDTLRKVAAAFPNYDPRVRPWYAPVAGSGQSRWSPIYTTAGERGDITISAATPVVADGNLLGVMEADVRLDSLNRFLREEPLRGQGQIFIVDALGLIVAHSELGSVLSDRRNAAGQRERLRISESTSAQIRTAEGYLREVPAAAGGSFHFQHLDARYFGRVTPYADPRGIDWRIVVLLPESELLGDSRSAGQGALLAAGAIAIIGLLLGLWVIQWAARPILRTAEAANRIARGDWDTDIADSSPLRETTVLVLAFNEMAHRLQRSFQQMQELLTHDSLTQLLTRRGLLEQVQWTEPKRAVLSLVGLNAFRAINDSVGYGTGDRLLQAVANRLRGHFPAPVLLARVGGDEFALLSLVEEEGDQSAERFGKAVLGLFATPFSAGADEVMVYASVGLVAGHLRGEGLEEWLRNGSIALGEAKRHGQSQWMVFEPGMADQAMERTRLASELRQALDKDQFLVHYQPVIELATGRVTGAEALLRWRSPTRGMVPPGVFIAMAEESDLILALGDWVMLRATRDIAQRLPYLPEDFGLHVNVSARQLIQSDFVEQVQRTLEASGLPAPHLTLELTESVLIEGDAVTAQQLSRLRALGLKIAIDDFGTGYTSLAYLSRLPFDCLKIDQTFVRDLVESSQNAAIVTAVLHMAKGFGVTVVAEGVETEAQARRLLQLGCASAQGYWFGRPAPLEQMSLAQRSLDGLGQGLK